MGAIYLNDIRYGGLSGPPEGDQVYVDPKLNIGVKIAEITVNDTTDSLYAPGGVTDVEVDGTSVVSQQGIAEIDLSGKQDVLTAGTNISIDSTTNTISAIDTTYNVFTTGNNGLVPAPTSADSAKVLQGDGTWVEQTGGTDVEANPSSAATDTLNKIGIDGTVYGISGGGGSGNVDDVYVNGESVLDANHIAQIKSYKEVTQSQYDALPSSKTSDGILYAITDAGGGGGGSSSIVALTQTEYDNLPSSKYTDNVLYLIKHGEENVNIDIFNNASAITLLNINGINLVNSSINANYVGNLEAYEASAGYEGFNIALYNLTVGDSYTLNFDFQFTSAQFFVDNYRTGYMITNTAKYDYDNWTSWTEDNIDRDLILHNHSITFTATATTMYIAFNLCGCSDNVQNYFTITNLYCESNSVEPIYTNFTMKYNGIDGPNGSGGGGSYTDVIGTLTAGQTTLTLTDSAITTNSTLDFYTDTFGINPTDVTVTTGSVTLTFEAQANNIEVKVRITSDSSGGSSETINYSTTEQDTGLKWVDGKSIYQKTFYIASLSASGGTFINLTDSNVNVDKFISYEWNGTRNDDVQTMNDNMILDWGQGSSAFCDFVYENNDHIKVKYVSSYYSYTDVYITIRYTKSTV